MLSKDQIIEVVKKYGPTLHLHPDEKYKMSSVEWFLERASLYKGGKKVSDVRGDVKALPTGTSTDESYWLDIPSDARPGDMSSAVAYVHARETSTSGLYGVQFWFFYPYNGPGTAKLYPVDKKVDLDPFGLHTGDWERVELLVNEKLVPQKMWLAAHGSGAWTTLNVANRLDLYSSRNGHATYDKIGQNLTEEKKKVLGQTIYDIGLRNDTEKGGASIDCSTRYRLLDHDAPAWLDYPGLWGPIVDFTKVLKDTLKDIPSVVSSPLESLLKSLPDEVKGYQGPNGPKMKSSVWNKGTPG
jgi:hypothetical protein